MCYIYVYNIVIEETQQHEMKYVLVVSYGCEYAK